MQTTTIDLVTLVRKLNDPLKHAFIVDNIGEIVDSTDDSFVQDVTTNLVKNNDHKSLVNLWIESVKAGREQRISRLYPISSLDYIEFARHSVEPILRKHSEISNKLFENVNQLIETSDNPQKAYEAIGDASLEYGWTTRESWGSHTNTGRYDIAIPYYILSKNAEKLFEASKLSYGKSKYENEVFEAFKILYTQFKLSQELKTKVEDYLRKIASSAGYSYSEDKRIQAAELIGDFSALKKGLYESLKEKLGPQKQIYNRLKQDNAVNDSEVMSEIKSVIKSEGDELKKFIPWADMIHLPIPKQTILEAVDRVGLSNRSLTRTALEYLKRTSQLIQDETHALEITANKPDRRFA